MIIEHADVFLPDKHFHQQTIFIEKDKFADSTTDTTTIDGSGCYLIPGLIDIHFHGCMGYDFSDAALDGLKEIGKYELLHGVTSICPASMTLPEDTLSQICETANQYQKTWVSGVTAELVGIHLEGPFVSPAKKGAQNESFIQIPNDTLTRKLLTQSNHLIRLMTLAPELEHAMRFIETFGKDFCISVGHTCCDYDTAMQAFEKGARHLTHMYNAMSPLSHRSPGPIGAGMSTDFVTAELICDNVHLHPAAIRSALALFGDERIVFISDSMRATGKPDGNYTLGGLDVTVTGNQALLHDGTLAGSVTNLMDCMKTAVFSMEIPLETAICCTTINPAKVIGIDHLYGSIETKKYADFVLLDKETLNLRHVISHGNLVV